MTPTTESPALTFNEGLAVAMGRESEKLQARLVRARRALSAHLRPGFKAGEFQFEKQRLVDSSGRFCLQWKTRREPAAPISSKNQQTRVGVVQWMSMERSDDLHAGGQGR
jgi:hypothetical protein